MRNLDLDSLRIFKAVAEFGGVSRAAGQLNRVQSNVTTRVKNLEDRLGVKLFHRHGGRLVLSSEGKTLLDYAERLLRLSAEAESVMRHGRPQGRLRIGTMESTAATRLPAILAQFHTSYPDIQIELVTATSGALVDKVQRGEIEAAFVAEPFTGTGLARQPAFLEELVLIAPKSAAPIGAPRDIANLTLIAFAAGCSYRHVLEQWLRDAGAAPARILEFGSYHAIVACVAAGSGIAIVPRALVATLRLENEVNSFPLPAALSRSHTLLVWRQDERSAALEALGSFIPAGATVRRPVRVAA
ncbi:MAG: LysR substrate-binding domain-containing protein [Telluria sp.]